MEKDSQRDVWIENSREILVLQKNSRKNVALGQNPRYYVDLK